MEKALGQTIVIINQPGASGSIGTRSALEATKDGYTWTAGAAQDLGASPMQSLRTVILPLLNPAIFASLMVVFATVIDDFVISQFLSADASSETVPMKIYSSLRATATPAVNALATVMLLFTLAAILLAVFVPRMLRRGERGSAVEDFALEM